MAHRPSEYKAVALWHRDTGSSARYCQDVQELAAAEDAPLDALYKDVEGMWKTISTLSPAHPFRVRAKEQGIEFAAPSIVDLNAETWRIGPNYPVGARLRSYDFPGRTDCYVEGKLTGYKWVEGCNRYCIKVDKVVWEGKTQEIQETSYPRMVYPPCNGTRRMFGGMCVGVERVD